MLEGENPRWLSYRWQRDTRYYEAHLKQDLFGWVVVRNWGGVRRAAGQVVTEPVADYRSGLRVLAHISRQRRQRNYRRCRE